MKEAKIKSLQVDFNALLNKRNFVKSDVEINHIHEEDVINLIDIDSILIDKLLEINSLMNQII